MALLYFLLFLLLIFAIIAAVIYFFGTFASRIKYVLLFALLVGWIAIAGYSYYQHKKTVYLDKIYYEYLHSKTLQCRDTFGIQRKVNKKSFNFISGTLVFMGKEGTKYEGLVVPIDSCKVDGK
ncbi:hypothetical protein [Nitratiruptor sp. SB155-2]|uniref:hypothetical protein n=1 Tax=Nitratiruptor sp. (strain SB155-2) TaxID=387092 RepID=UPI000158721C|nr:hypothetical protein [Nitratiruptor sp. SB155-2]BAF70371.1 conserved hypothetical protein [Nitratiruptor sp. SB155-2]